MLKKITVLLVSDGREPFEKLQLALDDLVLAEFPAGVKTYRAASNKEVAMLLERPDSPQMIFTDTTFSDGTWADVLRLAARYLAPVIVVSRLVDHELYIQALERGAFEFVVPPFISADLAHIVRCAAWKWSNRRLIQDCAA